MKMKAMLVAMSLVLVAGGVFAADAKIKVLVVTGGHGFQAKPFFKVFEDNAEITFTKASQGKSSQAYDRDDLLSYDVIVLYDMVQKITDKQKKNFLSLFDKGVGLVAMHHCIGSYQAWPEFEKIIGGKYLLKPEVRDGVKFPKSGYKHGVDVAVTVMAKDHPITQGLKDFVIHDETYFTCTIAPETKKLLSTTTTPSAKYLGWCHDVKKSRVTYLMGGHDGKAYSNPNFRKLIANAIRWAAKK